MSIQKLPSGRLRVQCHDPAAERRCPSCAKQLDDECERCGGRGVVKGANVSITKILTRAELEKLGAVNGTFGANERKKARRAREKAKEKLGERRSGITVHDWWMTWTTDPIWARLKESTNRHNKERTSNFVKRYRDVPLDDVGDEIVAAYLAGGRNDARVPALRAMFRDATKPAAGRLLASNPFGELGIKQRRGNRGKQPPTEKQMWSMLDWARRITPPSFADYLEAACFTGIRPGELDALQFPQVRWADDEIDVTIQWNAKTSEFTEPKYGPYTIALVGHARDVMLRAKARRDNESPYVFPTLRGNHYTPSTRTHHWNRVRAKMGWDEEGRVVTLYMATKHYFGWYAMNVLGLDSAVIAEQFGHKDGGKLVEELYGHPDKRLRRAKIRAAFDATAQVRPLRSIEGGAA